MCYNTGVKPTIVLALLALSLAACASPRDPGPARPPTLTRGPSPTATALRTPAARVPTVGGIPAYGFTPQAQYLLSSSADLLAVCSPPLYQRVRAQVRSLYAGATTTSEFSTGRVDVEERLLFSVPPEVQPILVMNVLVHEARHIEMGEIGTARDPEDDANQFFPIIVRDCAQGLDISPIYSAW